eukprot:scaffold357229_cov46-Prasinocladus_malaysianus.AAC.1
METNVELALDVAALYKVPSASSALSKAACSGISKGPFGYYATNDMLCQKSDLLVGDERLKTATIALQESANVIFRDKAQVLAELE